VPPPDLESAIDSVLVAAGVAPKTPPYIVVVGADHGLTDSQDWMSIGREVAGAYPAAPMVLGPPTFVAQDTILTLPVQAAWLSRMRDQLVAELVDAEAAVALPYEPLPLGVLLAAPWTGITHAQRHRLAQIVRDAIAFPVSFPVAAVDAFAVAPDGALQSIATFPLYGF
jgi:hypothetical protein